MKRLCLLCSAAAFTTFGYLPTNLFAQEGGPCTDDIASLRRDLSTRVGLGAPVSEPDYGQRKGPNDTAGQRTASTAPGGAGQPVGTPETDRAQKGGASRERGGTPGTVGGVAGPVGAAAGAGQADAIASGRIATSPDDVRRQSENRPTAAAEAAQGGAAATASGPSSEDRASQAKMALQRAVDLNAKGDRSCADAVKQAQGLMPPR